MANKIVIGEYTFEDDKLLSGKATFEHSMIGETLSVDTFTFGIVAESVDAFLDHNNEIFQTADEEPLVVSGYTSFDSVEYGTPVYYYQDNSLWGKFFINTIARTGKNTYSVECFSLIGLLANSRHYGGMYNGVLASTVIADILNGITYTLDASLATVTVRGYLPIASKRDNLQQILFVINAAVKIGADGSMQIVPMQQNSVSRIDGTRCYEGGSVEVGDTVDGVQLTEHNYFISQEQLTLFDDSITGTELITFSEPYHSLAITGGRLLESGVNYAKVAPPSGQSAAAITLTGKKYTHVTRVVSAGTTTVTGSENVKTVTGAYLANPEIADELCDRVFDYLSCNTRIKEAIVMGAERPADVVEIYNPYTEQYVEACMEKMNVTLSGTNKGECEFIVGFEPEGVVSGFQHYAMLTGNGTWSKSGNNMTLAQTSGNWVIDGQTVSGSRSLGNVSKFRMILVGGGGGGANGTAGSAGGDDTTTYEETWYKSGSSYNQRLINVNYQAGSGGQGGTGGSGGQAGKVFELSIVPENGDSGNITIGAGGSGGVSPTAGGNTTLSKGGISYSSANGKSYAYGYIEAKSGLTFAGTGVSGKNGGNGGSGTSNADESGGNGGDVSPYTGGRGSSYRAESGGDGYPYWNQQWYGAGGGGASGSANGSNATSSSTPNGGNGANGGNGTAGTNYGQGGGGGHGGGGGGGASHYHYYDWSRWGNGYERLSLGTGGTGGTAGTGANGKQGCLVIYY